MNDARDELAVIPCPECGARVEMARFFGSRGCAVCGADLGKVPHVNLSIRLRGGHEGADDAITPHGINPRPVVALRHMPLRGVGRAGLRFFSAWSLIAAA